MGRPGGCFNGHRNGGKPLLLLVLRKPPNHPQVHQNHYQDHQDHPGARFMGCPLWVVSIFLKGDGVLLASSLTTLASRPLRRLHYTENGRTSSSLFRVVYNQSPGTVRPQTKNHTWSWPGTRCSFGFVGSSFCFIRFSLFCVFPNSCS